MAKAEIEVSAVDKTKEALESAKRNLRGLGEQVQAMPAAFSALGLSMAAAFAVNSLKTVIDQADGLNKLAQKTGLATEELSQLQYAAKLADVSNETLNTGIKKLNISIAEGLAGDKDKIALFKSLGITTQDLGKGTKEVMLLIADSYSKAKDGAGKVAVGNGLMGKSAEEMIPLLNGGRKGIQDLMKEADKLGLTISTEFAKEAEEFNDNLTRMQVSGQRVAITMGSDLVKGLGEAMKAMAEAAVEGGKLRGIIAGIQMLMTGNDQHKNNVALVEQTESLLRAEKELETWRAIDVRKGQGESLQTKQSKERLAAVKSEIATTMVYRRDLQAQQEKIDAAANLKASSGNGSIVSPPKGDGAADAAKKLAQEKRLMLELSGLSGSFVQDWDMLSAAYARGALSLQGLTEKQAALLAKQPAIKAMHDAEKQRMEDLEKGESRNLKISKDLLDASAAENEQRIRGLRTLSEEIEEIGLSGEALRKVRLARLDANIALQESIVLGQKDLRGNDAATRLAEEKLRLMREERTLQGQGAVKGAEATEAEDNRRRIESISESISQGILEGFRDGQSIVDVFLRELKAQFAKTVLQPLISPIVQVGNDTLGGLMKGITSGKGFGDILGGIDKMSAGGAGAFVPDAGMASYAAEYASLIGFDGGGYTGNGPRAGGLDGKGGFLAMMHPQESVLDHTKGSKGASTPRGDTHIVYNFGDGVSRADLMAGMQLVRAQSRLDRKEDPVRRR